MQAKPDLVSWFIFVEERVVVVHHATINSVRAIINLVNYCLSQDVVTWDDVSTAYCLSSSGD